MNAALLPQFERVVVVFEDRPDGGLRVYSDDVPGFVLSHSNAQAALADVVPALEGLISDMLGARVRVELMPGQRDAVMRERRPMELPLPRRLEYVTHLAA
jgi:hypothetical protein